MRDWLSGIASLVIFCGTIALIGKVLELIVKYPLWFLGGIFGFVVFIIFPWFIGREERKERERRY